MNRRLTRTRQEGCLSDLLLDRWVAGELDETEQQRARAHVASCTVCRAARDAIEAQQRAFAQAPALPLAGAVSASPANAIESPRRSPARPRRRWRTRVVLPVAVAAAAALLLALLLPDLLRHGGTPPGGGAGYRTKGPAVRVELYIQSKGVARAGASGDNVAPGDALQLLYSSPRPRRVGVFGVDGAYVVNAYYPRSGQLPPARAGERVRLPLSIELDATAGRERIFVVFCEASHDVAELRATFERAAAAARSSSSTTVAPTVPADCRFERIVLHKKGSSR